MRLITGAIGSQVMRITDALVNDNAEALKILLPEILSSECPNSYIGNVFVRAATHGYLESYKLIIGEVFKHPEQHYDNVKQAITCAIDENHEWIANNLLDKTPSHLYIYHENVLHFALRAAARCNNIAIAQRILEQDLSIRSINAPLSIACSRDHAEIVLLMVKSLMREDEETTATYPHPKVERGRVLEESLNESIRNKSHSILAILLPPYLECAAYYDAPCDHFTANKILEKVRV